MTRQGELLEKPKRRTRGQLMHVCDAGHESVIARAKEHIFDEEETDAVA